MSATARHVVGIDLGTNNIVVAHAPLGGSAPITLLEILRRTAAGEVDDQALLSVGELPTDALARRFWA